MLVRFGVPWDVAMTLDAVERLAFIVILGQAEGGQVFDWNGLTWRDR